MDDQRITVLEARLDSMLPTLATKGDVDALRAEILFALQKMDSAHRTMIFQSSADPAVALHKTMRWGTVLVVALLVGLLWIDVAMFI